MENTFEVLFGEREQLKRFTLHTDFSIPRSEFFRAARSAVWNKSQKPSILEDDDPEVFANYMRCVYADRLPFAKDPEDSYFECLIQLYVLADKLGDLMTANMVMDRLVSLSEEVNLTPNFDDIELSYKFTVSGSPLRAVLRDLLIYEGSETDDKLETSGLLFEFYRDATRELMKINLRIQSGEMTFAAAFDAHFSTMGRCHYHQHNKNHSEMACNLKCKPSQSADHTGGSG
jgi:hypothetical protein